VSEELKYDRRRLFRHCGEDHCCRRTRHDRFRGRTIQELPRSDSSVEGHFHSIPTSGKRSPGWTALFLSTTLATSVTGFLFPFQKFTPEIGVGIVSMIALALAIPALYVFDLSGGWRSTLRGQLCGGPLPERVCGNRAGLPETTQTKGAGAQTV
jgi:hypothetical protein